MLQGAQSLLSPMPSAFTALGVGTVSAIGPIIAHTMTDRAGLAPTQTLGILSDNALPQHQVTAYLFVLGFACMFFVYALGLTVLRIGTRLRQGIWSDVDPKRVALVVNSENEALHKLFFETRISVSALDGLGFAIFSLFLTGGISIGLLGDWWFGVMCMIAAPVCCIGLWFQSESYLKSFDEIVEHTLALAK